MKTSIALVSTMICGRRSRLGDDSKAGWAIAIYAVLHGRKGCMAVDESQPACRSLSPRKIYPCFHGRDGSNAAHCNLHCGASCKLHDRTLPGRCGTDCCRLRSATIGTTLF